MNTTMKNNTNIAYRQVGDYNIPNLTLPPEEANITLGKWGMLYKDYLEKHKKVFFSTLLMQGKLYQHCAKVEKQAREMFDTLVEQMKTAEGVTEQLKEENQLEWVCRMQNIEARARELVCTELIFK
ncbi:MAG: TnpV protein [Clostridia bacterium]|nr:TnpV protein [Clostridia bacterium]